MEFSWTTFFLELINFIVLIWILKKLLYKPIMEAVTKHKKALQDAHDQAEQLKKEASELESQYKSRLVEWEKEAEEKKINLNKDLNALKEKKMEALQLELTNEKDKQKTIENNLLQIKIDKIHQESMALASHFISKIFKKIADDTLEKKIIAFFIESVSTLSQDQLNKLKLESAQVATTVNIKSAYPLEPSQLEIIKKSIMDLCGQPIQFDYQQDSSLLSGLSITIGSFILQANLKDELKFFTELANDFS